MATSEDIFKLILDLGNSTKDAEELTGILDKLRSAADSVGGEFGELVNKSADVAESFKKFGEGVEEGGTKAKAGFGEIASGIGSVFTSFKAGNWSDVVGGLAKLAEGVPAIAKWAGGITAVGTAALAAWPTIKSWAEWLNKLNDEFVEATKVTDAYTAAIKAQDQALEASEQMAKARDITTKAAETPSSRQAERAALLKGMIAPPGGGGPITPESLLTDISKAVADAAAPDRDAQIKKINEDFANQMKYAAERLEGFQPDVIVTAFKKKAAATRNALLAPLLAAAKENQAQADELFKGVMAGDAGAMERALGILPEGTISREAIRLASPEEQAAQRQSRRFAEEQRQAATDRAKREADRQAARRTVQESIKSETDRHTREAIDRAAAEARGPGFESKMQQQRMEEAHKLDRELARQLQKQNQVPLGKSSGLQKIDPMSSIFEQNQAIAINQQLIADSIREDKAAINQLRQTRRQLQHDRSQANNGNQGG